MVIVLTVKLKAGGFVFPHNQEKKRPAHRSIALLCLNIATFQSMDLHQASLHTQPYKCVVDAVNKSEGWKAQHNEWASPVR